MKRILIILIVIMTGISCNNEFLEKIPTTSSVVENFYNSPTDAKQALTSVYNMLLRDDYWSLHIYAEIRSDLFAGGAGTGDGGGFQLLDRGLQWPETNAFQIHWTTYWGAIYRANTYLEAESQIDWTGNEKLRLQYQAEARFLRAYFHFYLTRMFGEIPALDRVISPDEIPARSSAEELYTLMIEDLKFASENALSEPYGQMKPENWGRATKWAAKALLTRVFMYYSGYYNQSEIAGINNSTALTYIEDVISNSGHNLVPEYASLWKVPCVSELGSLDSYAGETNQEVIWSVRFNNVGSGSYGGNQFVRMIGPRGTNIDPYGQGWGAMPVLPSFWNDFNNDDKRKKATILSWDDEGLTYNWETQQQAQYTGYSLKKYEILSIDGSPEPKPDWQTMADEDYIVLRYADVLLMAAELRSLVNGEGDAQAVTYLNRVRERAFGNSNYNYSNASINNILNERKFELAGEEIRYWDIMRSCKGDFSKLTTMLTYVDDNDGGDYSNSADTQSLDVDGSNFEKTKGLFQIPQNELDLMRGVFEQNPGYSAND
ncbi:MAG TPA: RagB/SusD family nutrient uptake outer membrane protein [Prolixibacteraceae bacterium]|nr:RagB/SusD family nutrient uptake outer membrane protein [Prolixibacteraceae bacterium]